MKDFWKWDGRSHWMIRASTPFYWRKYGRPWISLLWMAFRNFWMTLFRAKWTEMSIEFKTTPYHSGYCYCPDGSTTDLRVKFGEWFLWISRGRYWGKIPCNCDMVMHEMHIERGEIDCDCPASPLWSGKIDVLSELKELGIA